jgi:ThiF family/Prokaryotic homologs of the JAB domain
MQYALRLNGEQHQLLQSHLFPGDGKEAGALLLCGRRSGQRRHVLTTMKVEPIPLEVCERTAYRLTWPTSIALKLIDEASRRGLAIVKVHSHPGGFEQFSRFDDAADRSFLGSVLTWIEDGQPHGSAIMLPGGRLFARALTGPGAFEAFELVSVAGEDIHLWHAERDFQPPEFVLRQAQAFGEGTIEQLQRMSIAVVGTSGTGSPLIAQLVRSGVGRLVLIDPDHIEEKNLNRIAFSTFADIGKPKVDVLAQAVRGIGLGTEVVTVREEIGYPDAVRLVAECDLLFGCMDSATGRDLLNRIATFYNLPYIDVGVALRARPGGGVDTVSAAVHYLQPGRSSLRSRGVYDAEDVRAETMKRNAPAQYQQQLEEKYIRGVQENRPAVMAVNTFASATAVLEMLARIHPYRYDNSYALQQYEHHSGFVARKSEDDLERCEVLAKHVGRGDVVPLLDRPELSEIDEAA